MSNSVINLASGLEIIGLGVRRAAVFMGFGLNAMADPNFRNYELVKLTGLEFMPRSVPEEMLSEFKAEFSNWVTANGFRELVQSFESFLDRIYGCVLYVDITTKGIDVMTAKKRLKSFTHDGITKKLYRLSHEYSIVTPKEAALDSINLTRNCLTHRHGLVSEKDGDPELIVRWWGFDIVLETKGGKRTLLRHPIENGGVVVKEESRVLALYVERTSAFPIGTVVHLAGRDVAEICQMMLIAGGDITRSFLEFAKGRGVQVQDVEPTRQDRDSAK